MALNNHQAFWYRCHCRMGRSRSERVTHQHLWCGVYTMATAISIECWLWQTLSQESASHTVWRTEGIPPFLTADSSADAVVASSVAISHPRNHCQTTKSCRRTGVAPRLCFYNGGNEMETEGESRMCAAIIDETVMINNEEISRCFLFIMPGLLLY